jgi:hypothetical protein
MTGWYGTITMQIWSWFLTGRVANYIYVIYKGSTTASDVLVEGVISTDTFNLIASSIAHQLSEVDRLENSSPSFLLAITGSTLGNFYFNYAENATFPYPFFTLVPPSPPLGSATYYSIIPSTSTIPSNITIRFFTV